MADTNHRVCQVDHGWVLGYDNNHDHHHRDFMGKAEVIEFKVYESQAARFLEEVQGLWREEYEENG